MSEKKRKLPQQRRKGAQHAGTRTRRVSKARQRATRRKEGKHGH
jgi:hypothetical protein